MVDYERDTFPVTTGKGVVEYKGKCRKCGWTGKQRPTEHEALADALFWHTCRGF